MKRQAVILLVVCVVPLALCEFGCVYLWVGGFDLSITITDPPDSLRWVYCCGAEDQNQAERYRRFLIDIEEGRVFQFAEQGSSAYANPYDGTPLRIHIMTAGEDSVLLGRTRASQKYNWLVVIAERADGTRVGRVVDLAGTHKTKQVYVTVR